MKIAVWKTGHEIADTVAGAIWNGLDGSKAIFNANDYPLGSIEIADIHIGYGILRGMDHIFKACEKLGKPYFCIDKGYLKPDHYDGYYRVSLNGTQQTILKGLDYDYGRFDRLGIDIPDRQIHGSKRTQPKTLICPPTDYVCKFFGVTPWSAVKYPEPYEPTLIREKGCERLLQDDLDKCDKVITFNSAVGWESLRQGIEVVSSPEHSIIGAYQKLVDKSIHTDSNERRKLFSIMASLQLTLSEMRQGKLWPLLQNLLTLPSAGIVEKQ